MMNYEPWIHPCLTKLKVGDMVQIKGYYFKDRLYAFVGYLIRYDKKLYCPVFTTGSVKTFLSEEDIVTKIVKGKK